MAAKGRSRPRAYACSTYPMEKGVSNTVAATLALPSAPSPTGQLRILPVPTLAAQVESTLER
jgi:hypothetical protein